MSTRASAVDFTAQQQSFLQKHTNWVPAWEKNVERYPELLRCAVEQQHDPAASSGGTSPLPLHRNTSLIQPRFEVRLRSLDQQLLLAILLHLSGQRIE
jgi:hypothetical protein